MYLPSLNAQILPQCGLLLMWSTTGMGQFGPAVLAPAIVAVCRFRIRKMLKRVRV